MKVFVNSLPKSGTNLLEKLIRLIGINHSGNSIASSNILGRYSFAKSVLHQDHFSGHSIPVGLEYPVSVSEKWLNKTLHICSKEYLSGHASYSGQLDYLIGVHGIRMLQIYRDPRAVLVSWAKYISEEANKWHPLHEHIKKMELIDRILLLLHGGEVGGVYYSSFYEILQRSEGWLHSSNSHIVKFEELIGSKGGGSDSVQRQSIVLILKHIGMQYEETSLDVLQEQLYGGTHTFRSGQVDSWKKYIDKDINNSIASSLKDCRLVKQLGYTLNY